MEMKTKYIEAHIAKIINGKLKFLCLKRQSFQVFPNIWQPITGKIKAGEKAFQAAKREILEETGIVTEQLFVLPKVTSFYLIEDDSIYHSPVFFFLADKNVEIEISNEHSEYKWESAKEAKCIYAWSGQRESVDVILEYFNNNFNELQIISFY